MIVLDNPTYEKVLDYFKEKEFAGIVRNIVKVNEDILKLTEGADKEVTHIFNKKDLKELDGFEITLIFKRIEGDLSFDIKNITIFDNEDEWLSAYSRIKE